MAVYSPVTPRQQVYTPTGGLNSLFVCTVATRTSAEKYPRCVAVEVILFLLLSSLVRSLCLSVCVTVALPYGKFS